MMFLKSMVFGENVVIQYLNELEKANKVLAVRMVEKLYEFKYELDALYQGYVGCKIVIAKFSFDSKFEAVSISGPVTLGGVAGAFSFVHEFKRYGFNEIEHLTEKGLLVASANAILLNSVYDVYLKMSVFVEENLLNIIAVNSDQLSLFNEEIQD
jgi:hypothetical protein